MRLQGVKSGDVVRLDGEPSLWLVDERIDAHRWRVRLSARPLVNRIVTSIEVVALWRKAKGSK